MTGPRARPWGVALRGACGSRTLARAAAVCVGGTGLGMQSGFNTNVRHRGVVFHVQTEDSGLAHPHVITHLYHHGTILASVKREYAELVDSENLPRALKEMMETLHAAMLGKLRRGDFDAVIRERLGANVFGEEEPAAPQRPAASEPTRAEAAAAPPPAGERPLDEMILDYLVESARKRKQRVP